MTEQLAIKKIHIDTRFRTVGSKSSSNFSIQLSTPVRLPPNTVMYVSNICLPVSWYMIAAGRNNKFYYYKNNNVLSTAIIPDGNYTVDLLAAILTQSFAVSATGLFVVTYDIELNIIKITPTGSNTIRLPTDEELIAQGIILPNSINPILQNYTNNTMYTNLNPYISNYIDLFPIRNVYLQCQNILTGSDNMLASGEGNIICAIPINAKYNQLVISDRLISMDYNTVGNQTINLLKFTLINIWGEEISLNNNHFSFSLLFTKL